MISKMLSVCVEIEAIVVWCFGERVYVRSYYGYALHTNSNRAKIDTLILGNVAVHKMQIRWKFGCRLCKTASSSSNQLDS